MKIKCSKCGQIYTVDNKECPYCLSISQKAVPVVAKGIHPKYTHSRGERYIFKKKLGQGGNGEVLEFEDTILQRQVAIKFPLETMQNDIVLQEARIGGFLEHPNILPVYDIGVSAQKSYRKLSKRYLIIFFDFYKRQIQGQSRSAWIPHLSNSLREFGAG